VIATTEFVPNSNKESIKQQTPYEIVINPYSIQITQHKFNPKIVRKEQRTSTHVT